MKRFLYVGNWGFHPAPKGISVFEYDDETGNIDLIENIHQDIAAGQLDIDYEKGILYAVNEAGDRPGEYGGGGKLLAFRIDGETGRLTLVNERDSLCPEPSYIRRDATGRYLLTCHCADPWHVTKIVRNEDGTLSNEVLFDDAAVVLFRLNEDGSIGEAVDFKTWEGCNKLDEKHQVNVDPVSGHIQLVEIISRLHAVLPSPDGKMFITLDKGMDKIYAFKIDYENEKIIHTDTWQAAWQSFPRYAYFHPTLNIMYANSEFCSDVNVFSYDSENGKLNYIKTVSCTDKDYGLVEGKPVGAQDILVHPDGKTLYVTTCGINSITVFDLDSDGMPAFRQIINSDGNLPRGIAISPDKRFLLSGNMVSCDITLFKINEDGTLKYTGKKSEAVSPSAMRFYPA